MLSVTAVLMLGSGSVISIFANGIAQIPCEVDADQTLFYVEIGMLAELNAAQGYFTVQAALAPSSHVLVPSCRLTGGFAMVNWFNPNPHAGDFVFTVGGYHRAYSPPAWYPKVDRLGVSFTLGKMINITGNVYFAVTPKCVMGGGGLHMGLDVGPVSAWLDAAVDVFIQFKPFHYTADLMVSVGCAISIKVWFVHVRISANVGAALHIEGPSPFGGIANVDFYLFSFTIHFGGRLEPPPAASLPDFYQMVAVPGPTATNPPSTAAASDAVDPMMSRLKFTLTAGLFPQAPPAQSPTGSFPDTGASKPWLVKTGAFSCDLGADFALSAAYLVDDPDNMDPSTNTGITPIVTSTGNDVLGTFYSKPMKLSDPISSAMQIFVWQIDADGTRTIRNDFKTVPIFKDVPTAIWGRYDPAEDPATPGNAVPPALTDSYQSTMSLCMGISIVGPDPIKPSTVVQDFDATAAFRDTIHPTVGNEYFLHDSGPAQSAFLAGGELFATETPPQRWEHFGTEWAHAADDGKDILGAVAVDGTQSDGMLKMAAHWLGWDSKARDSAASGSSARAPWVLNGNLPKHLRDNLGVEYAVLPRMTEVGA